MSKTKKRPIPILTPFKAIGELFTLITKDVRKLFTGHIQCEHCDRWIKRDEEVLPVHTYGLFVKLEKSEDVCRDCFDKEMEKRGIKQHL